MLQHALTHGRYVLVSMVRPEESAGRMKDLRMKTRARFVRVRAHNYGKLPAWHPGAGSDAYVFIDEIIIE